MTYTYKLARRLAISRNLAMLTVFVLLAACTGDTTGPEASSTPAMPLAPLAFRVVPSAVTIETNQPIRFRGESHARRGEPYASQMSWASSGGSIDPNGIFTAPAPGTYKIVGRGRRPMRPDTSIVVVVPPILNLSAIKVSPDSATVTAGASHSFTARGRLRGGRPVPIGVVWSATGGDIDPSGVYTAGDTAGTHRVIATNTAGTVADTAVVIISAGRPGPDPDPDPDPTPDPTPDPIPPPAAVTQLIVVPASATLPIGGTKHLKAYGRTGTGDSVAVAVSFRATGGTITTGGLYTAGQAAGSFRVVATSGTLADTAAVTLIRALGSGGGSGIPYGVFSAFDGTNYKADSDHFTLSIGGISASNILERLSAARSSGKKIFLGMTGGSHAKYKTAGVFDLAKWQGVMETYNTPQIRQAIAAGVADGTIIGNSVMDEPHNTLSRNNSWGPRGTMTKALVDQMCGHVKTMFPTLPVGVVHPHDLFEPTKSYRVCDFIVSQYAHRKGDVEKFRDDGMALARRDGHTIAFSMNILNGGVQAARDGRWECSPTLTAGRGTFDPNCRMTAEQVREWGITLGSSGCALTMWKYDSRYMSVPENRQAFRDVAAHLATLPAKSCRRSS